MTHEDYMKRCIQLAQNGLGTTYPNPMVGSVVVHNNIIIGEGWHYQAGKPHAEVNAINNTKDKIVLPEATIYVSLEPCSHFGKTPPCSDLIIASGIKKVVIGTIDPFAKVAGNGIKKLMNAGCEVIIGTLEKECQELNKRFFTFHNKKRPYIFLKWAQTADGFISPNDSQNKERKPVWITNEYSKQWVHKQRAAEQAILVGTETVIKDNPSLNIRFWEGSNPTRVVIDLNNRIPKKSTVLDNTQPTIVFTKSDFRKESENLIFEQISETKSLTDQICQVLYKYQIQSIIIEGGKKTLQTFIDANLWDEAYVFIGTTTFFKSGTEAPKINASVTTVESIKNDRLTHYKND